MDIIKPEDFHIELDETPEPLTPEEQEEIKNTETIISDFPVREGDEVGVKTETTEQSESTS